MNLITLLAIVVAVVSLVEWQLCRISVMTFVWYLTEKGFPLPSDADMKKGSRYVVAHTAYINRAATDAPEGAVAINSSLRGLVCLSQINKHYAFIIAIDQDSNLYVQYVQGDAGKGWIKLSSFDGSYNSLTDKPDIPTVQDILDALPTWTGGSY